MNKLNVSKVFKDFKTTLSKKSPEILTGLGIAGMVTTTVLAVKATPKAIKLINDEKSKIFDNLDSKEVPGNCIDYRDVSLKPVEVIKTTWKCYIPAVTTGVFSIACLIGSQSVNSRRNAALATAYKISETALSEYKEKVIETIGEKKEKTIKDSIAKDKVEKNPVDSSNVIITGNGKTLCFDATFGQYFESDIESIKSAVNNINYKMLGSEYVSLNDFYDELGIDRIDIGDSLGWNISKHGKVEIDFSSQIAKDGRPCIVIEYLVAPQYDYHKFA